MYLDHAATSPLRPEALAAMSAELVSVGNPSSLHTSGRRARRVVEESRESIAAVLGVAPGDVVFTEVSAQFWEYPGQILRTFTVEAEPTPLYRDLHAAAEAACDAILRLNPADATALTALGGMALEEGRPDEAEKLLKIIRSKPTVTVINLQRPAVIPGISK